MSGSGSGSGSYTSAKRLSGTVNQRGRHGNDWLFGGFSVRESFGKLVHGRGEQEATQSPEEEQSQEEMERGRR